MLHWAVAFVLLSGLFAFTFSRLQYEWHWDAVWRYREAFLQGWWTTVWVSAMAMVLSLTLGLLGAVLQSAPIPAVRYLARVYIELVRGTPLLVQILIFFYVIAGAVELHNRYVVGIAALAFFSGAYIAEIIRAGLQAVGRSQRDSARAIGLTRSQTFRLVVLPQAIRQILPPLAGQFVSLIKDSSLLSIIAVSELTLNAQQIAAFTYGNFESYLPLAVAYLVLTLPVSLWSRHLEKKFAYET